MKVKSSITRLTGVALASFSLLAYAAPNPVSYDQMVQYVNAALSSVSTQLTATQWQAACTSGSPNSAAGCYGNVASPAFTTLSNRLGGFTSIANINTASAPANSVYIKAFFAGTNTPVTATNLSVTVANSAARCALFYQAGAGVGNTGVASYNPTAGNTPSEFQIAPQVITIQVFNSTSINTPNVMTLNNQFQTPGSATAITQPIYLLCAGYSPTDGSTAAALNVTAV